MLSGVLQRNANHEARVSNIFAQNDIRRWLLMLLSNVGVNLLVVPAGIFFLSFSKWYVVGNTANSSIGLGIFLSHLERDTDWPGRNATRPIKLDIPCANVLLGFLHGVSRIPCWFRCQATYKDERRAEDMHNLHNATKDQPG